MERKSENQAPTKNLEESPEETKARLYEWHRRNGSLGVFFELYGERKGPELER
jgi:hypothetical protein